MQKLSLLFILVTIGLAASAQDSTRNQQNRKSDRKETRRQKVNALIKQSEEGVMVFSKQSILGIQFRTNGYGGFYEFGKMKTTRKTMIFRLDINETKSQKEQKLENGGVFFANSFVYGKVNHFYPTTLGVGQQYILGQKGNKNGVAVSAVYNAGLALGLLRPYYIDVKDPLTGNTVTIKFTSQDSALFLGPTIIGSGGFGKGWSEIKVRPGAYAKAALRFDYGRFNEVVSGIEAGISVEAYADKIPIMLYQKDKRIFFQGYISLLFGHRK
ncbi:MAG: hypothetical protein ACHQEB_05480 [Chitinophagales bacterium]